MAVNQDQTGAVVFVHDHQNQSNPKIINPQRFISIPVFPVNHSHFLYMDEQRTISLLQFMAVQGIVPSLEDDRKREYVILKLKQIVFSWIKKIAWQRRFPNDKISAASATVLTFGSYGLGVHGPESDIDALCVAPFFATMAEDFFVVLRNMLKSHEEISEIVCVKDAKVPLMRFKIDGISIDLPFAQLKVSSVLDNVDILNPYYLRGIDETSWKSLSGVRANKSIIRLIPNIENFQSVLRCIKLWAKKRGVYGTLLGFLGGVHLAILAAFICQRNPNASLNVLISSFFETFAFWPWPTPVILQDGMVPAPGDCLETRSMMPFRLPYSPYEYCHTNITKSTFYKIRTEFLRGHSFTKDILRPSFVWSNLFQQFPYVTKYARFVKIYLSASNKDKLADWVGWVKSRFRLLITKLEEVQGLCDPNPTEYVDGEVGEPNIVFYWGLQPGKRNFTDIEAVENHFMKSINNGYQELPGRIELSIVQTSDLLNNPQFGSESWKETKGYSKLTEYNHQARVPLYSHHLPTYFVGYAAING